jgi:hypothetical protein
MLRVFFLLCGSIRPHKNTTFYIIQTILEEFFITVESRLTIEEIDQFKKDVDALGHSRTKIAEKMGLDRSNFSNYYHEKGSHPITRNFLKKFYTAWGDELRALHEKQKTIHAEEPDTPPETIELDKVGYLPDEEYRDAFIHTLQKNNDSLLDNLGKALELVSTNKKLVETNQELAGTNRKLVDAHISFLGQQLGKPDKRSGDEKAEGQDEAGGSQAAGAI